MSAAAAAVTAAAGGGDRRWRRWATRRWTPSSLTATAYRCPHAQRRRGLEYRPFMAHDCCEPDRRFSRETRLAWTPPFDCGAADNN
jgi:hypothetical protein